VRRNWKRFRYRLEFLGVSLIAGAVPLLTRRACVGLAKFLGRAHWRLDAKGRAVALANLQAAFGDKYSPAERERIGRASFENFARALIDLFWASRLNQENHARHLRIVDYDRMRKIAAECGSNIFLVTHFGAYEWVSLAGGFVGVTGTIVTQEFKNGRLDAIFARARGQTGQKMTGRAQAALKLLRALKKKNGGGAGLLIDLTLPPSMPSAVLTVFGGLKICATILHAVLHQRTGVPMTPAVGIPLPDGSCVATAYPALSFPKETPPAAIAQAVWDFFEPFIHERPELWLWNYKHFRYRPADATPGTAAGKRYPFYARECGPFDRLIVAQATGDAVRSG
jgi:KDO2-lipid IV(A) lauroyltransferase